MTETNEKQILNIEEIPCNEISDEAVLSKSPLVSARIITYNHEPYIARAIEGVLMQETDFPIELVIGEDCSTDRTRDIVFEYQKKYPEIIRVVTSEHNVGSYQNGLRTTNACRGKYIAYCEGDDYWTDPLKLQKQVDFLEANPDCGMVHSDGDYFYVKKKKLIKSYINSKNVDLNSVNNIFSAIIESNYPVITCSVCLRRDLLKSMMPELNRMPRFKMGDTSKWLEFAKRSKIHFFNESMVQYNLLEESASQSRDPSKLLAFKKSGYALLKYFIDKYGVSWETEKICHERFNKIILYYAYLSDCKADANEAMNCLEQYCPSGITLINKLEYLGTGNKLFRIISVVVRIIVKIFKKVQDTFSYKTTRRARNI